MPSPYDYNSVLSGLGGDFADVIRAKIQQNREREAFQQFQQGITEAHAEPIQRGEVPAQPAPIGQNGLPTRLSTPAQPIMGVNVSQQQLPPSDPRFLNAAMNYLQAAPGAANTLQSYLRLRELGQPTYSQADIPAGGERVTYKTTPGGPPMLERTDLGPPRTPEQPTHVSPGDYVWDSATKAYKQIGEAPSKYQPLIKQELNPTTNLPEDVVYSFNNKSGKWERQGTGAVPVQTSASRGPVKLVVDGSTGLSKYKYMSEITPKDRPLTAQAQNTGEMAGSVAAHIPGIIQEINELDAKGKLGPLAGRWSAFTTTGVGAGDDPEYATLYSDISLVKSGLSKVHFGARGGQMALERFDKMLNAEKMDKETMLGALKSISPWLEGYAKMGGAEVQGETPAPALKPTHRYNPSTGQIEQIQ